VQADVLARHRRLRGEGVRFLSGTDDNSLKNIEAAEAAELPVAKFVHAKAERFAALRGPLACGVKKFDSARRGALVIAAEPVQTARRADAFAVPAPLRSRSRARPRWR
jgi:hypothetical protein